MRKQLLAFLLVLILVFTTLSGCFSVAKISTERNDRKKDDGEETDPSEEETLPEQEELDEDLITEICQRTELQLITSAVSYESTLAGYSDSTPAYYGNVDDDPESELLFGGCVLYFEFTDEGRQTNIDYAPSGFTYYLDKDGNFYKSYGGGDVDVPQSDGSYKHYEDGFVIYNQDRSVSFAQANSYSDNCTYLVNGKEVTRQEYDKQWAQLGMTELSDQSVPFTAYDYDGAYADALTEQLDSYFAAEFASNYHGKFTGDIDDDGMEEALLIVENFTEPWFEEIMAMDDPMFKGLVAQTLSLVRTRTGFVLIDPNGKDVQVRTHCVEGGVAVVDEAVLSAKDNVIYIGDAVSQMPVDIADMDYHKTQLEAMAAANGWSNLSVQEVNLSGGQQSDFLCTYQLGGKVYVAVIILRDGYLYKAYSDALNDDTFIITQYEGKPAILSYTHYVGQYDGKVYEDHYYCFLIIDRNGNLVAIEGEDLSSSDGAVEENALKAFMDKLKAYLTDTQVLYDPFGLSGMPVIPEGVTPPEIPDPEDIEPNEPEQELTKLEYWVENCHRIYLSEADLQGFTKEDCRIARNAVYAHSGRRFQDATLTSYFEGFDWYNGTVDPNSFDQNMLNDYQNENLNLVIEYEKTMGYR